MSHQRTAVKYSIGDSQGAYTECPASLIDLGHLRALQGRGCGPSKNRRGALALKAWTSQISGQVALFALGIIALFYAQGCDQAPEPALASGSQIFGRGGLLIGYRKQSGRISRVVIIGCTINWSKVHGPYLEKGYHPSRSGQRHVNGKRYYIVGEKAYYAPPGDLVLIHGWAEACVVVQNVPDAELADFVRRVAEDMDNTDAALRRLVRNRGNEKARLLVGKLMTGEIVGTQWRDEHGIAAVETIPYKDLPKYP